ncbi:class I SAM-dependent methyltransferase [Legionella sp. W05-934-2]|jgi:ubiquinone/menaquinone biosynthesis C-methylase UbiE|uniref:class I SAM-dependent methyltransferase n=1 Tax=Legionella sp. W05-934-2 TaxID=1198649 RepID=UPI003463671A
MDNTQRFSNRVENYLLARPGYPQAIVDLLKEKCHLTAHSLVADIGSGTGIFTKLLLDEGIQVFGVEPNQAMRQAAEKYLANYSLFQSIDGQADHTQLPKHSIDLITVAQAYHWFNKEQTEVEFLRVLKPTGSLFLVWNLRENNTPIMRDYEQLLIEFGTDYLNVSAENAQKQALTFHGQAFKTHSFDNHQDLNWPQLKSRLLSCSYIPSETAPNYNAMMHTLENLFNKHQRNGVIHFSYITKCYYLNLVF